MQISIAQLYDRIGRLVKENETTLVAIDGNGGSGKSALAAKLQECGENVKVIHMDDFYFPSSEIKANDKSEDDVGSDFDWKRLFDQVIHPLKQNKKAKYQRYDWDEDRLAEWYTVSTGGFVVIEGVYKMRRELIDSYSYKIWVDTPEGIRLRRGLERDGEGAREQWETEWMPSEDEYVDRHRPFEYADVIVDGSGENVDITSGKS